MLCGNKMPTRCNRGFYCRPYCLLNKFRAPLCPSSGAQEYYTAVAACGISCCGFQVAGLVWSWGLCVRFAGCCSILQLGNHSTKYHRQQPLYNTLELLMMGIVVPETCWASNKICNKTSVASIRHFISSFHTFATFPTKLFSLDLQNKILYTFLTLLMYAYIKVTLYSCMSFRHIGEWDNSSTHS